VRLIIQGKNRSFENPPGSYANMPKCHLHLTFEPKKEKIGDCEIVKEEG
jgi:hypothetical protein